MDAIEESDGRRRRSQRSRERILDAVFAALQNPEIEVTAERVAAEAGLSLSTIFRQFGDMEGLSRAMRERLERKVRPYFLAGPFEGTTQARVRELLRRRSAIFETLSPILQASLRQARPSQEERDSQGEARGALRAQMAAALAPELAEPAGAARAPVLEALLSPETWNHMRSVQQLDSPRVATLLEEAVLTLLASS